MAEEHGVKFEPDGIAHLLKDMLFQVPTHQRSYKWGREEHVRQLFRDIQDAMDDQQADGYFLGMVVLKRGETAKDRLEVIDGQQRLATVTIFLAAIRDYFQSKTDKTDKDRASDIQRDYIARRDTRTQEQEPHLYLNIEDRRFFESHVVKGQPVPEFKKKDNPPQSHRRIADAIAESKAQVEKLAALGSPDTAGNRLLDWVDYLLYKARVVAIYVPEEQNAYTLFETLNDRGLELSKADLIKNHLFGRAGNRLDSVRLLWTEMTTVLEEEDVTVDFIRHYWASQHEHVRTKQLYSKLKSKTQTSTAAHDTAVALRDNAKLYAALMNTNADLWKDHKETTRQHVKTLIEVGVSVIKPLALAVLRHFDENQALLAFNLFVNWSVRFLIAGGHRSEGAEMPFSKTALEVTGGTVTTAAQMAKSIGTTIPQDDAFRAAFCTATVTKGTLARYYLRAIEDKIANQPHPEWIVESDPEKVNLEHVLPVNPSAKWSVTPDDAEILHKRIGNLALLPKAVNTKIGNDSFDDKKPAFKDCSFEFTNWISKQNQWTEVEIDRRQELLADEAVKTWPLKVW
jgi:hypothetical protein